jgi:hypothetical protein
MRRIIGACNAIKRQQFENTNIWILSDSKSVVQALSSDSITSSLIYKCYQNLIDVCADKNYTQAWGPTAKRKRTSFVYLPLFRTCQFKWQRQRYTNEVSFSFRGSPLSQSLSMVTSCAAIGKMAGARAPSCDSRAVKAQLGLYRDYRVSHTIMFHMCVTFYVVTT